jgi:3-isopropylmalate/(R)-2-methylmalate dehydratase small subunit
MEPFVRLDAVAMPLPRANVDTDQIVPARFLKKPRSDNFGDYLFRELRADPAFVLNQSAYKDARILVAGRNFACGSSREHAVWALADGGFRAAIAPSFSDIFSSNALKNGFLPVVLPEDDVKQMLEMLAKHPGTRLTVDLQAQSVIGPGGTHHFEIAPFPRKCLIEGLDEIGYTLGQIEQVTAFEKRYQP